MEKNENISKPVLLEKKYCQLNSLGKIILNLNLY